MLIIAIIVGVSTTQWLWTILVLIILLCTFGIIGHVFREKIS